jgi:serine/threonine protein kinase
MVHRIVFIFRQNQNNASHIEEPALWHIFESLIKAGLVMEQGFTDQPNPQTAQKWPQIVHLDIKPENVFIADYPQVNPNNSSENFAMYPTFKLGDFGESTFRNLIGSRTRPRNQFFSRGTQEFLAPEHRTNYYAWQGRPNLNAKTNVWGVGITMMALMNLNTTAGDLDFREAARDEHDPALVPAFAPTVAARYSPRLRLMVQACVQYLQRGRPNFQTLLNEVCTFTGSHHHRDLAQGARFGTRDAMPPGLTLLNGLPANNYALGMAMPP